MTPPEAPTTPPRGDPRAGRKLLLLAAIAIAPVALSYGVYYLLPGVRSTTNYGELLPTQPVPDVRGTRVDGTPFTLAELRGRWVILLAAPARCEDDCRKALYATRQARTMQNVESDRIVRVWLVTDDAPLVTGVADENRDLVVVRTAALPTLPRGAAAIHLVDPLGNQVLAWPVNPDIKSVAKDLGRLLKASRIG